jgi:hypothetical protein
VAPASLQDQCQEELKAEGIKLLFPNADVMINPALLVLLGLIVGTLTGFFAAGGFLLTTGLLVFGVPPLFAVGTGLAVIMGSQLINTLKQRRLGNVDFRLAGLMLAGTIPGLILAERVNSMLESAGLAGPVIGYIYTGLLSTVSLFTLYDYWKGKKRSSVGQGDEVASVRLAHLIQTWRVPPASIKLPGLGSLSTYVPLPVSKIEHISAVIPVATGFGVSFFAGLLGAGSGFILLPLLIFVLGVPTTVAVGTGILQIFVTGSLGTMLYALSNSVDLLMVLIMLASSSLGTQLGASATRFVNPARIRVLYAFTLLGSGVAIALRQVSEMAPGAGFLSPVASILLLGVSGAICVIIVVLLFRAKRQAAPAASKARGPQDG